MLGGIVLALAEDDVDEGEEVVAEVPAEVLDRALFLLVLLLLLWMLTSFGRKVTAELVPTEPVPVVPAFADVEAVEAVAAADGVDVDGVVVVGVAAAALAVFVDAVQRLLLYVDLLRRLAELVHALPGLVRNVVQGLFRLSEDLVRAGRCRGGQFFHLRVQLPYHPFEALAALAGVRADVLGEDVLHVPVQWHPLDLDGRFLLEQRLARIRRMWHVAERFVHRQEAAKGQVDRLQRHQPFARIHRGLFAGVAHVRGTDQLLGPLREVPLGAD